MSINVRKKLPSLHTRQSLLFQFSGWKCLVEEGGQRTIDRPVGADRKATVTEVTSLYDRREPKSISEYTC